MKREPLSQSRLRELIHYDQATGVMTRLVASGGVPSGATMGTMRSDGYLWARLAGSSCLLHVLAWIYSTGKEPSGDIDHINGNRSDNRLENLRSVDHAVNCQNRRAAPSNSRSGLLGASYRPRLGLFQSRITVDGKQKSLGCYPTAEEAHAAYLSAKRQLHPGCTI